MAETQNSEGRTETVVKWEPDRNLVRELYDSPNPVTQEQFRKTLAPDVFAKPHGDAVDHFLNGLGIVTPGVAAARARAQAAHLIDPLYKEYLGTRLQNASAPTYDEAASRTGLTPSVHPSTMMPGPRVTTPGNLDEVIGGNQPAIGEPQLRPGLQPEGVPQQAGPFGLPQPYQPGPVSTTPLTPQYRFPTNEPGPLVPNMQAPLRPLDQQIVGARIEAMKHPRAGAAQGAVEYMDIRDNLLAETQASHPKTPVTAAEVSYASQVAGKVFGQGSRPGSPEREEVVQKNLFRPGESASLTAKNYASAEQDHASAEDIWNYTQTKNEKGKAERRSLDAGVVHAEQRVQTAQDKAAISAIESKLTFWKANMAWDTMKPDARQQMMMRILKDVLPEGTKIGPEDLGWFMSIFKNPKMTLQTDIPPKESVTAEPGRAYQPQSSVTPAPEGSRNPSAPSLAPSTPPAQAPISAEERLIELGRTMKDGEVIMSPVTGKKLRKEGNKLREVKE